MPELLTDPAHWHLQAQEARRRAQKLKDPEAKAVQLTMANKYDRLASRATEWLNKMRVFRNFLSPACPPRLEAIACSPLVNESGP